MSNIVELIDETIESNQPEPRQHLGASQIGHSCRRKIWYTFRMARQRDYPARILRIFERGKREEDIFIYYLELIGEDVYKLHPKTGKEIGFSDHGGHFAGTVDAMIHTSDGWIVAEFKTHNEKSFRLFDKRNVEEAKIEHYIQMQIYMHYMKVLRGLYLAVNKNTDELYAEIIDYRQDQAIYYIDRAKRIIESPEPLERVNDDPSWYLCAMCEFRVICHGQDKLSANCRTCIHATPEIGDNDKVWKCLMHQRELTFHDQKNGCDRYEAIPN